MGLYLGLDSSTQSLSAVVIDSDGGQVVLQEAVNFGQDLPEFGSPQGFLPNPDAQLRHADPLLWVAALELPVAGAVVGAGAGAAGTGVAVAAFGSPAMWAIAALSLSR